MINLMLGDCLELTKEIPDASVDAVVTSPPYFGGVRDYGVDGQFGSEPDPADYVESLVKLFGLIRRPLKADGSIWLNLGDVYAASGKGGGGKARDRASWDSIRGRKGFRMPAPGYKMKDLTLAPLQVADALRRDGWYLRSTIIWRKPCAGEPTRLDRPSVSHEYLFLLAPSGQYKVRNPGEPWWNHTVWDVTPERESSHPAVMPRELARRCVVASTSPGDMVLDPFSGAGTTGVVAKQQGRSYVGIELNPEYMEMSRKRIDETRVEMPLFNAPRRVLSRAVCP